jgi:hypothetical protein
MNPRLRMFLDSLVWCLGVGVLCALIARATGAAPAVSPGAADAWREECGSCHIAYAPRYLPAASWRALLEQLDRHFGVDASLEPTRLAAIRSYLEAQAAPAGTATTAADLPRISRLPWFEREHSEVPVDVWRRPSVRSRSNCGACHTAAARGVFNEDGIRIPR